MKATLSYSKYKPSGIEWLGEIPEHWEIRRLKYVACFAYGDSLAAEERSPGDYKVYGSNGIVGQHDTPNTKGPCLIVGRKGSFGKVSYSERPCFAIDTTYFIDARFTKSNLRWLYYCLQWLRLDSFTKDSAVPGLAREDAYENVLPYCHLDEQRAIAAFLDRETARIDELLEKKERQIELLQEKRAAIISRAVTKGLDPNVKMKDSGIEWLGEIPEHWDVKKIKFHSLLLNGYAFDSDAYAEEGIPLIRIGDVGNSIDWVNIKRVPYDFLPKLSRFQVSKGDILLALTGATIGKSSVYTYEQVALLNQRVGVIRGMKVSQEFLKYVVSAECFTKPIEFLCYGGAQENIGKEDVGNISTAIPPIDEQRAIAAFLDRETARIDALIEKIRKSINLLREYRAALITAAVTGKIDVRQENMDS